MAKNEGFRDFKTIISHRKDTKDVKHKRAKADINLRASCISCKYANPKRIFVNPMGNVIPVVI